MGKVLLLIDNSNIFVSGKETYGNESARFDYSSFEKLCAQGDSIVEKYIAGSTPPSNDSFWSKMKSKGYHVYTYERSPAGNGHTKEKAVDMSLGVIGTRAIEKIKPDRVVLVTGDGDFIPIAELRDYIKEEEGKSFVLDVWSFANAISPRLQKAADRFFFIDAYQEKVIFFQYKNGFAESFIQHNDRIKAEKAEQERKVSVMKKKAKPWGIGGGIAIVASIAICAIIHKDK